MKKRRPRIQLSSHKIDLSEFQELFEAAEVGATKKIDTIEDSDFDENDFISQETEDDWDSGDVEDYESIIMNALANGDADKYGF